MRKSLIQVLTLLLSAATAFAEDAAAPQQNPIAGFLPLIIIFVIFYFLLIRPQSKKQKEHQKMLNAVKKDDRIITSGGIYGTVTAVREGIIEVKIAEGVKVQLAKSAVGSVIPLEGAAQNAQTEAKTPDIIR
ncbi:MAG: preprotein translocase subunit YajC [Elusimicrobiota bacterium]